MGYKTIQIAYEARVAILTLNRPDKRNAISFELIDDFLRARRSGEVSTRSCSSLLARARRFAPAWI